jgi:hypothetical protein
LTRRNMIAYLSETFAVLGGRTWSIKELEADLYKSKV